MNIHEQRLVDALRQQIADLHARVEHAKAPAKRGPSKAINPALLWQERTVAAILAAVAAEFGGDPDELRQPLSRRHYVVMRRHVAMYLCRYVGMSFPDTASALGCASHTTAVYAIKCVEKMRETPSVAAALKRLESAIDQRLAKAMAT